MLLKIMAATIAGLILSRDASTTICFISSTGIKEAVFLEGFINLPITLCLKENFSNTKSKISFSSET